MTEQTINNDKIMKCYTCKISCEKSQETIRLMNKEVDDNKFSYNTQNFYGRNNDFLKINNLKRDIYNERVLLNKELILLDEAEEKAKGLKWIV